MHFIESETLNLTSLFLDRDHNSLQDLSGPWSFNDTSDISKYEDFDHSRIGEGIFTNKSSPGAQCWTDAVITACFTYINISYIISPK